MRRHTDRLGDGNADGGEERRGGRVGHELRESAGEQEHGDDDQHGSRMRADEVEDAVRDEFSRAARVHGLCQGKHAREEEDRRPVNALICLLFRYAAREYAGESPDDRRGLHGDVDLLFEHHRDDRSDENCRADDHLPCIFGCFGGFVVHLAF